LYAYEISPAMAAQWDTRWADACCTAAKTGRSSSRDDHDLSIDDLPVFESPSHGYVLLHRGDRVLCLCTRPVRIKPNVRVKGQKFDPPGWLQTEMLEETFRGKPRLTEFVAAQELRAADAIRDTVVEMVMDTYRVEPGLDEGTVVVLGRIEHSQGLCLSPARLAAMNQDGAWVGFGPVDSVEAVREGMRAAKLATLDRKGDGLLLVSSMSEGHVDPGVAGEVFASAGCRSMRLVRAGLHVDHDLDTRFGDL